MKAELLNAPIMLMEEALAMEHCAGTRRYLRECAQGQSRIFRLAPEVPDESGPAGQQSRTTTLELVRQGQGWCIRQHQGLRNRPVTPAEARLAQQVLLCWTAAQEGPRAQAARWLGLPTQHHTGG